MLPSLWGTFAIHKKLFDEFLQVCRMYCVTLGAAALNQVPLDWMGNKRNISEAIRQAKEKGVKLLCLPELCTTGYGCEDMFLSTSVIERAWKMVEELAPETSGIAIALGLPIRHYNTVYNGVALLVNGVILGVVAKRSLAGDGVYYEPRWFKAWPKGEISTLYGTYPVGDLLFDIDGVRIGFEICEDAWVSNRPGRDHAAAGVDILLNPSASHFVFGKRDARRGFVKDGSRAFGAAYVFCNHLGCESGRVIFDGDTMIASNGDVVAEGERFSLNDVQLLTATIDLDVNRLQQGRVASHTPDFSSELRVVAEHDFSLRSDTLPGDKPARAPWEQSAHLKNEEFTRAVTLGLLDYLRKSKMHGFVVSLSGGADSTAVSLLVSLMIRRGWQELGREAFLNKFSHIPGISKAASPEEMTEQMLRCVYQKTVNSSRETQTSAREIAHALNASFSEVAIDSLVEEYQGLVAKMLGRELSWDKDDAALQNVQARVRSPSVWLLANATNSLLLTTSNRSEGSVGYATMDGDTSGGFNPIGGVDKHFLRGWLSWMETEGPLDLGPVPALSYVNKLAPTAELRPLAMQQTDEGDLMPYEVLDVLERYAIGQKKDPIECFYMMNGRFGTRYSHKQIGHWITRFFRLWSFSQWKRERLAPSFTLDEYNVDPRSWCRFPILSSGFSKELSELEGIIEKL